MTVQPHEHAAKRQDIAERLERLPSSLWQTKVRVLIGTVTFFEAFDQMLVSYTLPLIKQQWSLTPPMLTAAVTAGSAGMLLGALVCGMLADRFGRIRVMVAAMLVTAVCSLLLVVAANFTAFASLRLLQGFGIGGEVPVAAAFISEIARSAGRGRFVLVYELAFPAGLTCAALIASWIVPALGWRPLYLIGALPGAFALLVRKFVPESPRWLAARGDLAGAEGAMAAIESRVRSATGRDLPVPARTTEVTGRAARGRLRELFGRDYLRRTVLVSVLWFCGYFVNYGITAWLPTIYTANYGVPLATALNYTLITSVAGFAGCVGVALLVDRVGRRTSLVVGPGVGAAMLGVLVLLGARSGAEVALWCSLSAAFVFAANLCLYLYTAELYPTRIRAVGSSLGGICNRLGVIVGPIVVGGLIAAGAGTVAVFAVLGAVAAVSAIAALFGEETSGRSLEELSS